MFNKKGEFGEIIATIAIFGLLVSAGIVGITLLISKGFEKESDCSNVGIKLLNMKNNSYDVCYTGSLTNLKLKIDIQNTGTKNIEGLLINNIGKKNSEKIVSKQSIKAGTNKMIEINYDKLINGDIKQINIIPFHSRLNATCYERIVVTNSIGQC